jgi:hypothetical protein
MKTICLVVVWILMGSIAVFAQRVEILSANRVAWTPGGINMRSLTD